MDIAICLKFFPHKYDRIAARIYIYIFDQRNGNN